MTSDTVFGPSAPELGWVPAPRYALRRRRVLALLDRLPRGEVLEVGCGAGALLGELADRGMTCTALESSAQARGVAKRMNETRRGIEIHSAPAANWSAAFDLVIALEVLEHIEDDAAILRLWRGWLRPGGRVLLSVPARSSRWSATDTWAGHFRRYERPGLLNLLERQGFAVEHHECSGFPLSNLTEKLRGWRHGRLLRRARLNSGDALDRAAQTATSGIQLALETKLFRWQTSWAGVKVFQASCWLQDRVLDRELGTGYLVMARRP